jgi:hypothetical protein
VRCADRPESRLGGCGVSADHGSEWSRVHCLQRTGTRHPCLALRFQHLLEYLVPNPALVLSSGFLRQLLESLSARASAAHLSPSAAPADGQATARAANAATARRRAPTTGRHTTTERQTTTEHQTTTERQANERGPSAGPRPAAAGLLATALTQPRQHRHRCATARDGASSEAERTWLASGILFS